MIDVREEAGRDRRGTNAAMVRDLFGRLTVWHALFLVIIVAVAPLLYVFDLTRTSAVVVAGGASVVAILTAVWRRTVRRPGAWLLIALSAALLTIGDAFFAQATTGVIHSPEFPNVPDIAFLSAYLPLAVGVLWLAQPTSATRKPLLVLDTAMLALAGSLVIWILVLRPVIDSTAGGIFTMTVAVATLVGYVAVLAAALGALINFGRRPEILVIALGTAVFLFADLLYIRARVLGTWGDSAPGGFLLLTFVVACGIAALLPGEQEPKHAARTPQRGFGPMGLAAISLGLLAAPTVLLVEASRGLVETGYLVGIEALVIAALVLARVALYARATRRRVEVTSVVRRTLGALAVATNERQVRGMVRDAVREILPAGTDSDVRLVRDGRRGVVPEVRAGPGNERGTPGQLVYPLDSGTTVTAAAGAEGVSTAGGVALVTAPAGLLDEHYQALQAMLDQAALALDRIDLVHRLEERERERYFRSVVNQSTDVILISQDGHIGYVSPSALRLFGRDVRGERFDRLVTPAEAGGPHWRSVEDGAEGLVDRPGGDSAVVQVYRRDLTADPSVQGVVTTLRDVTRERALRLDLERRANEDPLTGLANPTRFQEELRADTGNGGWAALFVDLDDFKAVNDTFGHQIGDDLLTLVARRIESCVRDRDLVARLGGDEFGVLLRGVDLAAARAITQRISDKLAEPATVGGVRVDSQASIGLSYLSDNTDPNMLVREADSALYTAKEAGKGRWRQYRAGMPAPTRQNLGARDRLTRALETDALTLFYQPIVRTSSAEPVGYEGLVRLRDGGPPLSAAEIIRVAESTGLIAEIGDWVLTRALTDMARFHDGPWADRYVAVNVAPRQLRLPDFGDRVTRQLAHAGVRPDRLVLEVTEGDLVGEDERAWNYLEDLRRDGVRVAIDDYGTGYASLSYLRQDAIDLIKVDGSFLADPGSARARVLVEAVADVTKRLGLDMVAEGVHDRTCRDLLVDIGCEYAQGYLFAKPMPADAAARWHFTGRE
ncbi:EAL domain-containing protein [Asanoa sp. NPDC050611]|uniref:putative bifunctional diguanylate cyclase/phosphodiesterase n=1 Tax=Asanoa sp. NPDC050611 TaxID=3157098 RepID=UPI0033F73703